MKQNTSWMCDLKERMKLINKTIHFSSIVQYHTKKTWQRVAMDQAHLVLLKTLCQTICKKLKLNSK